MSNLMKLFKKQTKQMINSNYLKNKNINKKYQNSIKIKLNKNLINRNSNKS